MHPALLRLCLLGLAIVVSPAMLRARTARPHHCSCVVSELSPPPTPSQLRTMLRNQGPWFVGRVIHVDSLARARWLANRPSGVSLPPTIYWFRLQRAWGMAPAESVAVLSPGGGIGCPDPVYEPSHEYVVGPVVVQDSLYVPGSCEPYPDPFERTTPSGRRLEQTLGKPTWRRR